MAMLNNQRVKVFQVTGGWLVAPLHSDLHTSCSSPSPAEHWPRPSPGRLQSHDLNRKSLEHCWSIVGATSKKIEMDKILNRFK